MHKVVRNAAPSRLIAKDNSWRQEIAGDPEANHKWSKFAKTKLKKVTLGRLEEMYQGCCCYCEAKLGDVSYPEIEHFKPKSKSEYKHLCYDYNNLHYCCRKCNLEKSDDYYESMIDPSAHETENYLIYEKYVAKALDGINGRGQIMIDTIGLNARKELENTRISYFNEFENLYSVSIECIMSLKERNLTEQEVNYITIFLNCVFNKSKHGHPFCSMIKQNFYKGAQNIKKILEQKGYLQYYDQNE